MDNFIILQGLLRVLDDSKKDITICLYNEKDEPLISFILAGYEFLKDFISDDNVLEISFPTINQVNVKIDTKDDPEIIDPGGYYETHIIINGKNLEDYLVDFIGATDLAPGVTGLVPAPAAGDQNKYLRGDGTWHTVSGGGGGGDIDVTKESLGIPSDWDPGTASTFTIEQNTLIINSGEVPSLTITPTTVVTDVTTD